MGFSTMSLKYCIFGLIISSQIEIPYALPGDGLEDVIITLGKAPPDIENSIDSTSVYQISRTELLFHMEYASFHISNGKSITIDIHDDSDIESIRAYLLGTAMGAILHQRKMIPVHGSAIAIRKKGVIFTGESGSGKTSLCSTFIKNHYKFLSDDISVVTMDMFNGPYILPSLPQQRISAEIAKTMNIDIANLVKSEDKYVAHPINLFLRDHVTLSTIFELKPGNVDHVQSVKITGTEKLNKLIRNLYSPPVFMRMGIDPGYFTKCAEIAGKISYYYLIRPIGRLTLDEQLDHVISLVS